MTTAVVFAYHDVGVRCLSVLLDQGVRVPLVFTHQDSPTERIWFASVAALAARHGIDCVTPDNPNTPDWVERVRALRPDLIFSFYYRSMLSRELLVLPTRGAWNMHGSLLPKFRGRVPVNWAVLKGERETGATLHEMTEKPDAGRIATQVAVPILEDDLAVDVFRKVTVAAEIALSRVLPALADGSAPLRVQNLAAGSYFGGRRPEDGRIDWTRPAAEIHNLVRAVAPPYPGAFFDLDTNENTTSRFSLLRTRRLGPTRLAGPAIHSPLDQPHLLAACSDGEALELSQLELGGKTISREQFVERFGTRAVPLIRNVSGTPRPSSPESMHT